MIMASSTTDLNKVVDNSEPNVQKVSPAKSKSAPSDAIVEPPSSDDDGSLKTVSSVDRTSKSSAAMTTGVRKSLSQSTVVKNLTHEVRQMKERIRKLEDEVSTLHELLKVQDDITAETLAILPHSFKNPNEPTWKKYSNSPSVPDCRPKSDHKVDKFKDSGLNSTTQAMMLNNHAWYGDAFLYELLCQCKGYHPKDDNWFTSVYPFVAFEAFTKRMFDRSSFFRACVICIGYSDLFNAKSVTGYPMKQTLHKLLNYMNQHGADHIKVLSIPPARQMIKNVEYLKICQTTNKFFKAITRTHPFVDFINLDKFFVENSGDSFNYIGADNEVHVQIRDQLLMRKVNDHFEISIDPEMAKTVLSHIIDYDPPSKGYQNNNNSNGVHGTKRRSESEISPTFSAKRMHKSRPPSEDFDNHQYRPNDRRYEHEYNEFMHNYEHNQRMNSRSDRNSSPPWLKK